MRELEYIEYPVSSLPTMEEVAEACDRSECYEEYDSAIVGESEWRSRRNSGYKEPTKPRREKENKPRRGRGRRSL